MPQTPRVASIALTAVSLTLAAVVALSQTPPAGGAAAPAAPPAPAAPAAAAPAPAPAASASPASSPFATGKAASGESKAALCASCHGQAGNSVNPEWPRLAGQSAVYIAEQLRLFRAGVRNNPIMKPLAATLSDQDISDLALYYEAQTPTGLEADPSYWKSGQQVYLSGDPSREVPACVACHGPLGRGNLAAGYPALRAQQSVYVVKQLNDYASGARYTGPNPEQASPNGVMMLTLAKRMTPEEIRDVASYVQGMR